VKIRLAAVGQRPPEWVVNAFTEYVRRLPREMPLELVEIPPAGRRNTSVPQVRAREAQRLLDQVTPRSWVVALDEHGTAWSTLRLAERLEDWRMQGRDVVFLVGGADGLDPACLERADEVVSLSAMTLPHALVRVLLAEQLYRAWTVLSGHPYHRGD
jgi:23S rRNA (pseudouridine1915-N3)-methyltransferase